MNGAVTAKRLRESYDSGTASPVSVTGEILERAARLNPSLNCFITLLGDSAVKSAEESERRLKAGRPVGPLDGIPVAVKDIIYINGVRCTAGSKILANNIANYDSPVVRRLKAAGAVILGTTNLHEFACGVTNNNPHYGPARNPWDTERVSGGSSGGSAVTVATGLAAAAIGTDTGGSVRIPAALCGVVGLKPTYGRISRIGVVPLAGSFDTVGTLTNCAWDSAALLTCLAGAEPGDMTAGEVEVPDYVSRLAEAPTKARVGIPKSYFLESVDAGVEKTFSSFLDRLREMGAVVVEIDIRDADVLNETWKTVRRAEAFAFHERWLTDYPEMYGEDVRKALELGREIRASRYINAQNSRPSLRESFLESMKGVDFVASPTTSATAPKIGDESVEVNGTKTDVYSALIRLTSPFNLLGFPALSIPAGFAGGLPVGAQLVARPFEEESLLRLANAFEVDYGLAPPPPMA